MTRAALAVALMATPAMAENQRTWLDHSPNGYGPSTITLAEPRAPNAVATLTFINTKVHGADETFELSWSGIEVTVHFEWNANGGPQERIEVEAPPGYVAVPRWLDVGEDATGFVDIIRYEGS